MPAAATDSEVRSNPTGPEGPPERPAARTHARARIAVTQSAANFQSRIRSVLFVLRLIGRRSWIWTSRPASLAACWRLSAIDRSRVPRKSWALELLWFASNFSDRLVLFLLVLIAPTVVQGPLRWIVERPTRRWGLYLVIAVLLGVVQVAKG